MNATVASRLASLQPVVLVGGRSTRFGRDKLREPVGPDGAWLVDRPLSALRTVFGPRVAVVGDCHPEVAERGDLVIPDRYPGIGPAGGILSALEYSGGDVFVLAGDLLRVTADVVRAVVAADVGAWDAVGGEVVGGTAGTATAGTGTAGTAGDARESAWAVLAATDRVEPCVGVYRREVRELLAARVAAGVYRLHDLVPRERLVLVQVEERAVVNVNEAGDVG